MSGFGRRQQGSPRGAAARLGVPQVTPPVPPAPRPAGRRRQPSSPPGGGPESPLGDPDTPLRVKGGPGRGPPALAAAGTQGGPQLPRSPRRKVQSWPRSQGPGPRGAVAPSSPIPRGSPRPHLGPRGTAEASPWASHGCGGTCRAELGSPRPAAAFVFPAHIRPRGRAPVRGRSQDGKETEAGSPAGRMPRPGRAGRRCPRARSGRTLE